MKGFPDIPGFGSLNLSKLGFGGDDAGQTKPAKNDTASHVPSGESMQSLKHAPGAGRSAMKLLKQAKEMLTSSKTDAKPNTGTAAAKPQGEEHKTSATSHTETPPPVSANPPESANVSANATPAKTETPPPVPPKPPEYANLAADTTPAKTETPPPVPPKPPEYANLSANATPAKTDTPPPAHGNPGGKTDATGGLTASVMGTIEKLLTGKPTLPEWGAAWSNSVNTMGKKADELLSHFNASPHTRQSVGDLFNKIGHAFDGGKSPREAFAEIGKSLTALTQQLQHVRGEQTPASHGGPHELSGTPPASQGGPHELPGTPPGPHDGLHELPGTPGKTSTPEKTEGKTAGKAEATPHKDTAVDHGGDKKADKYAHLSPEEKRMQEMRDNAEKHYEMNKALDLFLSILEMMKSANSRANKLLSQL